MIVQQYMSFASLPDGVADFLQRAGQKNFFDSLAWFQTLLSNASPPGDRICIVVAENGGQPTAALVAKRRDDAGALRSRMLLSPSHGMYTSLYGPILRDEADREGLREIIRAVVQDKPRFQVMRFDSLERSSPVFDLIVTEFRAAGMIVQPFFNFHNWFEKVGGLSPEDYLASRSAQTRYFINRHVRRLQKSGRGHFNLVTGGPRLSAALIDYELVDLQSWKAPEPYPFCIPEIVRCAGAAGVLRLGLLYVNDEPAAAQIWIVSGGKATILRLHYAAKFAKLAVGTVLTYEMFRYVLENDRVEQIDFGRGNDPYKRKWLKSCRERWGLLVFNPLTVKGCLIASRHIGGHMLMGYARNLGIVRSDTVNELS